MNHVYVICIGILLLSTSHFLFGQKRVKRASLSTSVVNAHNIKRGSYKVQQSVGHMGVIGTVQQEHTTVLRGFLLPQSGAYAQTPASNIGISIYPVPFDRYIHIDFDTPVSGDMVVTLHDLVGQLIVELKQTAKQQQRIQLDRLAQAEYVISVQVMGKTFSQPILNYHRVKSNKEQ